MKMKIRKRKDRRRLNRRASMLEYQRIGERIKAGAPYLDAWLKKWN